MGERFFYSSVTILPLFPALGIVGLLGVMIGNWRGNSYVIKDKINWGWGIFAVWLVINSYFAHQPQEAWLGLANFLPFIALFISISPLLDSINKLRILAWCLVLPSLPIVILGLGQMWFNWRTYPLIKTILGWELVPQGIPEGRMSSVFINSNFLAIYLAITFILSLGLWLDIWYKKTTTTRELFLFNIIIVLNITGLFLARSRNAWGIAFIGLMIFAVYLGWNWLVYGLIGAGISVFWAGVAPKLGQEWIRIIIPQFIWGRLSSQAYLDQPVEILRITQWQFCWEKIQERPFLGWGLRNFTPLYEEKTNFWLGHPHNLFLMLGMEIGIISTILLCLIVGSILKRAISCFKKNQEDRVIILIYVMAFLSCVWFNLFDVSIFELRVNTISWILLAGLNGIGKRIKSLSDSNNSS